MDNFDSTNLLDIDPADLRGAMWWRIAAETLAEEALESLPPWHPERRGLTELLITIHQGGAALVDEYRAWQKREPKMTAAMAHAGRLHDARIRRRLVRWLAGKELNDQCIAR